MCCCLWSVNQQTKNGECLGVSKTGFSKTCCIDLHIYIYIYTHTHIVIHVHPCCLDTIHVYINVQRMMNMYGHKWLCVWYHTWTYMSTWTCMEIYGIEWKRRNADGEKPNIHFKKITVLLNPVLETPKENGCPRKGDPKRGTLPSKSVKSNFSATAPWPEGDNFPDPPFQNPLWGSVRRGCCAWVRSAAQSRAKYEVRICCVLVAYHLCCYCLVCVCCYDVVLDHYMCLCMLLL